MSRPRAEARLLAIEDDAAAARLVARVLEVHGYGDLKVVGTVAAGLAAAPYADIILLDHQLPDGNGLDILEALRAAPSKPSVIVVTAHGDEQLAAQALRLGAEDYLVKDGSLASLLPEVVERVRRGRALTSALAAAERDLMRAERLAAVGEMTVTLHHEINNPLMAATAAVDFLQHGSDPLTEVQRRELHEVQQALERIRLIVQRVGGLTAAPSREYGSGMRMLDLGAQGEQPVVLRGLAGIRIENEDIARVVGMLLRNEGWRVERCHTAEDLERLTRTIGTSLLVLELRPGTADPFDGFRPAADRDYRLAVVTPDAAAATALRADIVAVLPFDPDHFAADIAKLA